MIGMGIGVGFGGKVSSAAPPPTNPVSGSILYQLPDVLSSGLVSSYLDQSSSGNTGTASGGQRPTANLLDLNGKTTVSFNGSNYLTLTDEINLTEGTVHCFVNTLSSEASAVFGYGGEPGPYWFLLFMTDGNIYIGNGVTQNTWQYTATGEWLIVTVVATTTQQNIFINGVYLGPGTQASNPMGGIASIFDIGYGNTRFFTGKMGINLFYNTPLSNADRQTNEAFYSGYYAQTLGNQCLATGNSLVFGVNSTGNQNFPDIASIALGSSWVKIANLGIAGETTPQMITAAPTTIDPFSNTTLRNNICLAWELINDAVANVSQPDQVANVVGHMVTYGTARKAAGFKVIVGTMLSQGYNTNVTDTIRGEINAGILDPTQIGVAWDDVADMSWNPNVGGNGAWENTNYFSSVDKIHMTNYGYQCAAVIWGYYVSKNAILPAASEKTLIDFNGLTVSSFTTGAAGDAIVLLSNASQHYFWFQTGTEHDPGLTGTGVEVSLVGLTTAAQIAGAMAATIQGSLSGQWAATNVNGSGTLTAVQTIDVGTGSHKPAFAYNFGPVVSILKYGH
jgi:hypothetical protein